MSWPTTARSQHSGNGSSRRSSSSGSAASVRSPTAVESAEEHLITAGGDREEAIRRLVATHVRLAAVSGFVTGLGGIVTLPVTVPAAMAGMYIIATRMCAGIAHLRGYDVETDEVRSGILVALLGSAGTAVLRNTGVQIGQKSTAAALERLPAARSPRSTSGSATSWSRRRGRRASST